MCFCELKDSACVQKIRTNAKQRSITVKAVNLRNSFKKEMGNTLNRLFKKYFKNKMINNCKTEV